VLFTLSDSVGDETPRSTTELLTNVNLSHTIKSLFHAVLPMAEALPVADAVLFEFDGINGHKTIVSD